MEKLQEMRLCLNTLRNLEEQKLFLVIFYMENITGYRPQILNDNPILDYKYQFFKYHYLAELATSAALYNGLIYQSTLPVYSLEGVKYELSDNFI